MDYLQIFMWIYTKLCIQGFLIDNNTSLTDMHKSFTTYTVTYTNVFMQTFIND